jgi:putative Mg2+ transporter-C (MgtC) family protein
MDLSFFDAIPLRLTGSGGPTEAVIIFDILLALVLGLVFGYERFYHGRAAGVRTYGLVCMVAAGLTSVSCSPGLWFGGHLTGLGPIDPTRTVQGIVTGIGFLGAGIIMQDGLRISGLTTAASIWAAAAIGILTGLGLYAAAVLLTLLSMGFVMWGARLASLLPSRHPIMVTLLFKKGYMPGEEDVHLLTHAEGYEIAQGTTSINSRQGQMEWHFVAVAYGKRHKSPVAELTKKLSLFEGIESFQIARARN